jgi:hypothetical protein
VNAKKIISIYKKVIFAINKLELKQDKDDKPSLIYPFDINELISSIISIHEFIHMLGTELILVRKKKNSFEEVSSILFDINADLRHLRDILDDDLIDLCCYVSSRIIQYNDCEKNLNPHMAKKITFKKDDVIKIYKDIIQALRIIELQVLKKSLINGDAMLQAIEKVEPDINLLSEGIAIIKGQRKWTYYDIMLIMTRFHCGLTRLLYVIRDIQDAIDTLDEAIEVEQKLMMA